MKTMMHLSLKSGEKLHIRMRRQWIRGGIVKYGNRIFHIDPRKMYREKWPSSLIPFWSGWRMGIDFIEGNVSAIDPSILEPVPGTPERAEQDKRTSEILEVILEEARVKRVFGGGEKMDPLVIVVFFLMVIIAVEGVLMFLGLR
jgi:hypothetical protein